MKNAVYIHYGSTKFDPAHGFPIRNANDWSKPIGGLWASRVDASYGWKRWCEAEDFASCEKSNSFEFAMKDPSKVAVIRNKTDLLKLPTVASDFLLKRSEDFGTNIHLFIDFEECLRRGIDAIELCWFGDEYGGQRGDRMDYIMLAWDCDSIVVLNPEAVIPI